MKQTKKLLFYYGSLFAINLLAGLRFDGAAPTMLRFAFLVAVVAPALIQSLRLTPALITLFLISSTAGYVEGIMPSQLYWYALISGITVLLLILKRQKLGKSPNALILLFFYVLTINVLRGGTIEHITYSMLIVIFFCLILGYRDDQTLSLFSMVFALISLSLAIMFVMADPSSISSYGYSGLDRVNAFSDPNYFGCTLGMGALASVIELFRRPKKSRVIRYFYLVVAILSFVILVLNASRGGILAFMISTTTIFLFSKINKGVKVFASVAFFLLMFFMYTNDYFALLEYRVMNDTGGGSSRTIIWQYKLNSFFNHSDAFQLFLGYGHNGGLAIGGPEFGYGRGKILGFHNDLIAFLVDYGILGFTLFLSFFIYIINQAKRNVRFRVYCFSVLLFLAIHIMTLEPYTAGGLPIWAFTLYAILMSQTNQNYSL